MLWRELIAALKTWPDIATWFRAAKVSAAALAMIGALAWAGGFLSSAPRFGLNIVWANALLLFFVPTFFEEAVFRGLLFSAARRWSKRWAATVTVVAFTLWHPLQALLLDFPGSAVFLEPLFIFAVAILGMALSQLRIITKSLWPAILLHWIVVVVWKLF